MSLWLDLCYSVLLLLASPWLAWNAWRKGKYRHGLPAKLWGQLPARQGKRPCVWFHAVSVGEVNLLAPMIRLLEKRRATSNV